MGSDSGEIKALSQFQIHPQSTYGSLEPYQEWFMSTEIEVSYEHNQVYSNYHSNNNTLNFILRFINNQWNNKFYSISGSISCWPLKSQVTS